MKGFPFEWYTTPLFKSRSCKNVFHKEQEHPNIDSEIKNYHCLARSHFHFNGGKSTLLISADDIYKLYINGKFICYGPAPSYSDNYFYNEIDISSYLNVGDNVIAVHVYYQGMINRVWQSGDNLFGVGASINGKSLKWKYTECTAFSGNVLGYDTAFSENFDSRLFNENWNNKNFDDSEWENMLIAEGNHKFISQPTKLLEYSTVKPSIQNGIYDFGHEIAGTLKIRAQGKSGDEIIIHFGEELNDNSSVKYKLRADCIYEEIWTLDDGICTFENFDYKGFRYVQLLASGVKIISIEAIESNYPFDDEMCIMKSNDKALENVFILCKSTVKVCCQNSFIDCPTREKAQYLGDALITANSQILLTKDDSLLRKAIDDFSKTKKVCNGIMAVSSCSYMQEIADYSLLFGELLMLEYNFSKDQAFLKNYYDTAKNIILYFKNYEDENGLLTQVNEKWNMVDWPENYRDNYDFPLTRPKVGNGVHNVINAYYIGSIKTLNKIEDILKFPKSFDYESKKKTYLNAFQKNNLLVDSIGSSHSSLHANVFALYFDLIPENSKKEIINFILSKGLSCSVYVAYFMLKALCRNKYFEDAYKLIVNKTEHGWVNMLREGATTCFEAWGKEQKWNTSLCHAWASAPVAIIIEYLANADIPNLEIELLSHGGHYALPYNE